MGRFRNLAQGYRQAYAADRQPAPVPDDAPRGRPASATDRDLADLIAVPAPPPTSAAAPSTADHDEGEAAALAQHYAAAASAPGDHADPQFVPQGLGGPDLLAAGLHDGYYLHRDAARLRAILAAGGEARWCSSGALDMTTADGRAISYSPANAARLLAAGLLPADLATQAPTHTAARSRTRGQR